MDANGTRFHLLQGEEDWSRCRTVYGASTRAGASPPEAPPPADGGPQVQWNATKHEVTLRQRAFRFAGAAGERRLDPADRRGAARDRFGNWYWIAPDRHSVLALSSGTQAVSAFWPPEGAGPGGGPAADGGFRACAPAAPALPPTLQGLAVTEDHYLVVGTTAAGRGKAAGVLLFDLYAGGPPRHRQWPGGFTPFDIAPRSGGGVWILDRERARVWQLDRRFAVATEPRPDPPPEPGPFTSVGGAARGDAVARTPVRVEQGWAVPADDPVAVTALPAGGVLVLDRGNGPGFARVHWLDGGAARGAPASTEVMATYVEGEPGGTPFTLAGHDFALGARDDDDPEGWLGRLYVVGPEGNQAFAFGVARSAEGVRLEPVPEYYPMRLFGGRALAEVDGEPWYDCGDGWVKLVRQNRPRYAETGELATPVLDGGDPGCVWHRLMLDACIPPGTAVEVYSRGSDDWRDLMPADRLSPLERRALGAPDVAEVAGAADGEGLAEWRREPAPYLRGDGPELPYLPKETGPGRGTWELLFQRARGRYLQLKLVLCGDGRSTPRLRALRAWYPRFSYLDHYLPAVYREDTESARFLDRFLANMEGMFTAIEDRIAAAQILFDVESAPPEALDWLGRWFGVALDPSWEDARRRLFLRHAMEFFAARGTVRGLHLALRLALDECVDERLFAPAGRAARRAAPVRIIERFRARRTPPALLGDVGTAAPGPRRLDPVARWQPSSGGAELHRRYREALALAPGSEFPLAAAGAPHGWAGFAEQALGFLPRAGAAERAGWQQFLRRTYGSVAALNAAHGTAWSEFGEVRLPRQEPAAARLAGDWRAFLAGTPGRERRLWQDFLARRYRGVAALNAAWRAGWSTLAGVPLPDRLPPDGAPLADWYQFEGTVLAMHRTAHRFTVMLPVPRHMRTDTPAQQRRLALARTVLELEKPAHTVFDMRFYWAMFRLGEARLGDDTLIDLGSRSPELMAPMVLGAGYLSEGFLAAPRGRDAPERVQVGRDRVGRSARLGGP